MVKIRLQRHGRHKRPFYRMVACDERCRRDGRFLEIIGYYDPFAKDSMIKINSNALIKWINFGAQPTETVKKLIQRQMPNFFTDIEARRREKIRLKRKKRKERQISKAA
ncbi:MAG: 30S ribosomal protein S16 [Deltaproteobacteria bacterium]|nr:30S ribosomal protein S16 [Deltaproteobacteria bacterium]